MIERFRDDLVEFTEGACDRWLNIVRDEEIYDACHALNDLEPRTTAWEEAMRVMGQCFERLGTREAWANLNSYLRFLGADPCTDRILNHARALLASALASASDVPNVWSSQTANLLSQSGAASQFWIEYWKSPNRKAFRSCLTAAYEGGQPQTSEACVIVLGFNTWTLGSEDVLVEHPEVALHPIQDDLLRTVRIAWEQAGRPGVAWSLQPLHIRLAQMPPLGGNSLGLAAAVQMAALKQGRELDPACVALGALQGSSLKPVGYEMEKLVGMQQESLVSQRRGGPILTAFVVEDGPDDRHQALQGLKDRAFPISVKFVDTVDKAVQGMILSDRLAKAQDRYQKNGPLIRTALVDRLVEQIVSQRHHLSLYGPPLCGRKRIAIAVASEIRRRYPDWRAVLIPLQDTPSEPLHGQLLKALTNDFDEKSLQVLVDSLNERPTVVVLEGLPHFLPPKGNQNALRVLNFLLEQAKNMVCVFVSREAIGSAAIMEEEISPLGAEVPVPETERGYLNVDSVKLFVSLVRQRRPDSRFGLSDLRAVHSLCCALGGLPGLIQIYALRYPEVSPLDAAHEIADLQHNHAGNRDHQMVITTSLGAMFRRLQTDRPQAALLYACLSVFKGGWSRAAAQSVCAEVIDAAEIGASLDRLCELHLIQRRTLEKGGGSWYYFWPVICADAYSRLNHDYRDHNGLMRKLNSRLRAYYVGLIRDLEGHATGTDADRKKWQAIIGLERHNIASLIQAPVKTKKQVAEAALMALGVWRIYEDLGLLRDGQNMLEALKRQKSLPPLTRAWLGAGAGWLSYRRGDFAGARALLKESQENFKNGGDVATEGLAMVNNDLGVVEIRLGQWDDAIMFVRDSLGLYTDLIQREGPLPRLIRGQAFGNNNLGRCYRLAGDLIQARTHLEEARRLFLEDLHRESEAIFAQIELGYLAWEEGAESEAIDRAVEAQQKARYHGAKLQEARATILLGHTLGQIQRRVPDAARCYKEGLRLFLGLDASSGIAEALEALACLSWDEQGTTDTVFAGVLLGSADKWRSKSGETRPRLGEACCAPLFAAMSVGTFAKSLAAGRLMDIKDAARYALEQETDATGV